MENTPEKDCNGVRNTIMKTGTKDMNELISVIVPVYNVEKYLHRCIDSILAQTYNNLEIIIVDDGSPDRCPQICDEFQKRDERIVVIHKENAGLGMARNSGLNVASGKYVTFVDSDDWITASHIENLYRYLCDNRADFALGGYTRVTSSGEKNIKAISIPEGVFAGDDIHTEILLPLIGADVSSSKDVLIESSVAMNLYKMDVIREYGITFVDERNAVAEDYFFNLDFIHHSKRVVVTDEVGYFYYQNFSSISYRYTPKRFERTLNFYLLAKKKVSAYELQGVGHRVERSFLMKVRLAIRQIVLSDISGQEKYLQIKKILQDETVGEVLAQYPIGKYTPSMRLLTIMMKAKNIAGVFILVWLRENGRNNRLANQLMRWLGVGK